MNSDFSLVHVYDKLLALSSATLGVFTLAEFMLALALLALAAFAPRWGSRRFDTVERLFGGLAHRPIRQVLAVGLLAIALRALMLPWMGIAEASVADETSILLQAQTFAAGRLANPTHPFWEHFETFYVNQVPAYASMYFPGRGAPLAAGLLLAQNAWVGVWMSMVLMCMAATWMLQGWVALPMALLGGILVTLRLGVFSFWVNSYYGGAFIALGAMLVIGALPRILQAPRWRHGLLMGLGMVILMTSRPYEGFLLCFPVALALLLHLIRSRWQHARLTLVRVALPAVLMVGAGGGLLLAYNQATTGQPLKAAYQLNRETYASVPAFLISPPLKSLHQGPAYFQDYFAMEGANYGLRKSPLLWLRSGVAKLFHTWNFYIGAIFSAAFFAGLWSCRRDPFLLGTTAFFMGGYFLETWNFPQYTAPLFPLLLIFMMRGFEWLRARDPVRNPAGLFLARAMPVAALLMLALPATSFISGSLSMGVNATQTVCCTTSDKLRPALRQLLLDSPGRDLVLVNNGPNNPLGYEMVNNEPDIDKADIVWAHRLGTEKDNRLRQYFADRRVWEFEWLPADNKDKPGIDGHQPYRLTLLDPEFHKNKPGQP